ncbi:hypothetical protein CLF_107337 [Clonorchis sinensis]|uniref:Uncharacterized protein n=1 Tax=Clonorchis sinensis TaxID=79923 RepID=G7YGL9_CLOSI|nr:hypothetical protein CLF_107337 [Clonorchis sinensis]
MTVPCHQCTEILRFLDSPVTDIMFEMIGLGFAVLCAAGFLSWPRKFADEERSQCKIAGTFLLRLGSSLNDSYVASDAIQKPCV